MIKIKNNKFYYRNKPIEDAKKLGILMFQLLEENVIDEINFRREVKQLIDLKVETEKLDDFLNEKLKGKCIPVLKKEPFIHNYPTTNICISLMEYFLNSQENKEQ